MIKKMSFIGAVIAFLLVMMLPGFSINTFAAEDPLIIVSMGDSYSAGEGIEPYYGQDKPLADRIKDRDWLSRRSTLGWPAMLEVPGFEGTMADYRVTGNSTNSCQWYFVASGGALASNIDSAEQKIVAYKAEMTASGIVYHSNTEYLPTQLSIFDNIKGQVDYVTITIGGNDASFGEAIKTCASHSTYLGSSSLDEKVEVLLQGEDYLRNILFRTYGNIIEAAGPQATILIVGYPKILDVDGKGSLYNTKEATALNGAVSAFNREMERQAGLLREEGFNVYFVSVEDAFDADGGHSAYSDDPWIDGIILGAQPQEINDNNIIAGNSLHPNAKGALAYAKCVNAKIKELEDAYTVGTLSGKVIEAYDSKTPVSFAEYKVYDRNNYFVCRGKAGFNGEFSTPVTAGTYKVVISATGYKNYTTNVTVTKRHETVVEAEMFYASQAEMRGTVRGKIRNNISGTGLSKVSVTVRKGWDLISGGAVVDVATADTNGNYSINLPLGTYTFIFEKAGYVSDTLKVIVREGVTDNQDIKLSPMLNTTEYEIVLTWGGKGNDLDSHMVGKLSDGTDFHVYHGHKTQYDGLKAICTLSDDDTDGRGIETLKIKATGSGPYYFYVHRFAGEGSITATGATIEVYAKGKLEARFDVPTDSEAGVYWNAFAIVDGLLEVRNTITNQPDCSYATGISKASIRDSLGELKHMTDDEKVDLLIDIQAKETGDIAVEETKVDETAIEENTPEESTEQEETAEITAEEEPAIEEPAPEEAEAETEQEPESGNKPESEAEPEPETEEETTETEQETEQP